MAKRKRKTANAKAYRKVPKSRSVSEQVRRAIAASGRSLNSLADETRVDKATLSRFLSNERRIYSDALDVLADALGLELKPREGGER
jgi:transcriptional regulator with XRE-family HTH domain